MSPEPEYFGDSACRGKRRQRSSCTVKSPRKEQPKTSRASTHLCHAARDTHNTGRRLRVDLLKSELMRSVVCPSARGILHVVRSCCGMIPTTIPSGSV